ncbi:retrovirus-related pol polyprotein from transposon TNT 1-94 [Tanacetum coccineum]|uniref:Retrovirus-related pol polyprotein from transposon TNT 1-94 n=1 Tax=Tanacetum coccineum TaxID=301880 RepID=A0ABQ4ZHR3_9ASTR
MFMANLSSADPVYDEVSPSYDSNILSEVQDHDHFQDAICEHHEEHEMQDDVQPSYVVDSHADYTSDNNDLHEPKGQSVFKAPTYTVADNSLNAELAIYKEQVELYERRVRFELTEREQKIDEKLRIVICDRNIKEENLKKELHSVKLQLASTIQHNKLMVDEVTSLKKDFNQKENKYLEEFLDLKALKDKVEDKLFKQGQSIQTVHMMCKPRSYYDEVNKVAIGYKNPLCLHRARQVQPALYSGHVIVTPNHAPAVVRDCEETLEQSEISRKKMHDKMKANECVDNKVNITPPNYSKENFLATFTPQKQLTPEQLFWSQDIVKMKAEALKEQNTRPISHTPRNTVVNNLLNAELATYKEQVELYERRARFELTEREQKIDEQLRIVICDRNIKEENLKKELHSVKLQLASTIQHNKLMVDEVTSLKKDFNQKENKYLEEFLDLKALKDKVEDKLFKQGQSIQTVHMMCKPRSYYDEVNKVAIGYKNPLCLHRARQVQPALYSGHVIVTPNHAPAVVRDGEETLELTEISRKKMHEKMKANECVDNKVNITPPNYSKENFLATFTPQKQLTPEQIFWSQDIVKMKAEALKEQNTRPIKALTVYPPNTPATLVPRVLPTKSQVKINIFTLRQLFSEFEKTCKKRITPTGITEGERGFEQTKTCYLTEVIPFFKTLQEHFEGIQKALTKEVKEMSNAFDEEAELDQSIVDRKHDEIERKNLLIEHDNIIADGLSKEVFYVASNSELNVSRFTEMQKAHNVVKARCLELKAELSNLRDDVPSLQGKDNVIQRLKMQISQLKETRSKLDRILDFRARDFQISQLTEKVNGLQEQNELFRAENVKIKQHYKELYDSIKIKHAKHTEQTTALKNENESLKVQLQNTVSCVTTNQVKPNVLALGKHAIVVEPIPPQNRNNREVHLVYLRHLKESIDTLCEIVEEAKVERPLDRSLAFACRYTKHSQELLEYAFGTCPKLFNQQDKKHANTPRNKQVTFEDQIATSSSTTHKHVEPMHTQKSNVPVPPSTGVNSCTNASGSQPRSILKKHRIPPAKSNSLKKVEDHSRTIRSSLKTMNHVDSSTSSKRTVVQIVLWYLDSGCSKHMTGDRSRLMNFVKKFIGTVRFGNDHFGAIMGYGDYVIGDSVISRVYYVEGLGHNLFSVGQFCDSDLEVAFRKHSCYVRDTDGVELLKGSRGSNLYTISVEDMMKSSPICLLSKASKHKSWLWHRRLNHLNFGTINDLARKDLVRGLPRLKFEKDHLCSACQLGKSKKHTHKPKTENTNLEVLNTLHMDLCGPMRVQTINGKKYILVIVDDYSWFTWVMFLRSKDETPTVVIKFLKQIQVGLNITVRFIRTDNGTEFSTRLCMITMKALESFTKRQCQGLHSRTALSKDGTELLSRQLGQC